MKNTGKTDESLLTEYMAGNEGAFTTLFDRLYQPIFNYISVIVRNHDDANEVFSYTFEYLIRAIADKKSIVNVKLFLLKIARNRSLRIFRDKKRQHNKEEGFREYQLLIRPEDGTATVDKETYKRLDQAVANLPSEQQEVLMLKIKTAMTFSQISELLDVPTKTVASRYEYALKKLKDKMKHE